MVFARFAPIASKQHGPIASDSKFSDRIVKLSLTGRGESPFLKSSPRFCPEFPFGHSRPIATAVQVGRKLDSEIHCYVAWSGHFDPASTFSHREVQFSEPCCQPYSDCFLRVDSPLRLRGDRHRCLCLDGDANPAGSTTRWNGSRL